MNHTKVKFSLTGVSKLPKLQRVLRENLSAFLEYKEENDLVGMDMARKFLQMGYTRARRYTNYKGGRKYDKEGKVNERQIDETKAESAAIFMEKWKMVRKTKNILNLKRTPTPLWIKPIQRHTI